MGERPFGYRFAGRPIGNRFGGRPFGYRFGGRPIGNRFGGRPIGNRIGGRALLIPVKGTIEPSVPTTSGLVSVNLNVDKMIE